MLVEQVVPAPNAALRLAHTVAIRIVLATVTVPTTQGVRVRVVRHTSILACRPVAGDEVARRPTLGVLRENDRARRDQIVGG